MLTRSRGRASQLDVRVAGTPTGLTALSKRWPHLSWGVPTFVTVVVSLAIAVLWSRVYLSDWQLVGDEATIVLRSTDVFSLDTPLLGMPSAVSSWTTSADPFHPGPAVFWVLAPFTTALGPGVGGALAGTAVLAMVSVGFVVVTASRRLGPAWAPVAGLATTVLLMVEQQPWRPLNPLMALLPALVVCFCCWSVMAGDSRSWPPLAAFASFTLQADLAYLLMTGALLLAALTVTVIRYLRARHGGAPPFTTRQLTVTLTVFAISWALPVAESTAPPGNIDEMVKTAFAGVATVGMVDAARATWPILLIGFLLSTVAMLCQLRNRPFRSSLAITAGAAGLAAFVSTAATPSSVGVGDIYYRLPGIVTTVFMGFALCVLLIDVLPRRLRSDMAVIALSVICTVTVPEQLLAWATTTPTDGGWLNSAFPSVEPLSDQIDIALDPGEHALVPLGGGETVGLTRAVHLASVRAGRDFCVAPGDARYAGSNRLCSESVDGTLYLTFGTNPPRPGLRLVAEWRSGNHRDVPPVSGVPSNDRSAAVRLTGSSYFIGAVVAGTGQDRALVAGLDDAGLRATGQALLDDPDLLDELSDEAITELVRREFLVSVGDRTPLESNDLALELVPAISVWLDGPNSG